MPGGNFWETIGQSMLAGSSAAEKEQAIKRQLALAEQDRQDRLRQQATLDDFKRQQLAGENTDRQMRILNAAIEGGNPEQEVPEDVKDLAAQLHQSGRLETRQVGGPKAFQIANDGSMPGSAVDSLSNPASRTGTFVHQNPKDALEDFKVKAALSLMPDLMGQNVTAQGTALPSAPGAPAGATTGTAPDVNRKRAVAAFALGSPVANDLYPQKVDPFAGGLTGQDLYKSLSPQERNTVDQMHQYKFPVPTSGRMSDSQLRLMSVTSAVYPDFNPQQYQSRQKVLNSFTSGKDKDNLVSLNTAIKHLGTMADEANALNNYSIPLANTVKNWFGYETGNADLQKHIAGFTQSGHAVAGEMSKVFKGTGGTDQEIKDWEKGLSDNMPPAAQAGAIQAMLNLLQGRAGVLSNTYENGFGKSPEFSFLNDASKQTLQKLGVDPSSFDPGAGNPAHPAVGGPSDNKGGGQGLDKTMTILELNRRAQQMNLKPADLANKLKASGWNIVGSF